MPLFLGFHAHFSGVFLFLSVTKTNPGSHPLFLYFHPPQSSFIMKLAVRTSFYESGVSL
ncbi:hypothetical protein CLOSTHATH_00825 [Hungatella hathewayi DSM 13479]|uniref:Uncharacterized protein n=1 Tax=Hungatella hathewayi DSM 13479 TaxID=566550 RepID=D3AB54_9FIRM|nr:hypothetical protein CLOSTHATH_00825 [Hungatella hathewayi DSM 13479]